MKKFTRIFRYLLPHKKQLVFYFLYTILGITFSIISIGMLMPFLQLIFTNPNPKCIDCSTTGVSNNSAIAYVNNWLTSTIQSGPNGKIKALGIICTIMIICIILKNTFIYLSMSVLNPLKNNIVNKLRADIFKKILQLPIGFFTEQRKGDIMSRLTNDVGEVETSVVGTLDGWFRDPLTIIATLFTLFYISFTLTLFILILIPIMGFVIGRISKSLKKHSSIVAIKYGESMSTVDETLGGLRVIKAFNAEEQINTKFDTENRLLTQAKNRIGYRRDLASPLSEILGVLMFCCILGYGGYLVIQQKIDLDGATFLGFLGMFYMLIAPAKALSTSLSNMQKGVAAIERIEEVLNAPVVVDSNLNGLTITTFTNNIQFKNVSFKYEDKTILKDINLTINKGKTIALVGSSGAGKSTLADLVPRFHDVSGGELFIDGKNIKSYSLPTLRNLMSIVTQEPILFNDTIANNIALGNPTASLQDIEHAAKIANAHNFIMQKEKGYQTNIGDRGNKLSGGERQRITIARAVLKNPPILILDEATSSLDTESEKLVQDAINNLMTNRTSIVIAHRLSTIRHADEIIVLQKGEIVERGTHESLLSLNGFYSKLVNMQEVK
ncbi:MAG: ABC transporter ATP-binding protein [Ferruginibacter sp.]|nr:ABC transporter ATP-binding protein [Ferruginibacter sp.]